MTDKLTTMQEDLNAAKYLLNRHGFAFKIFGRDDVIRVIRDNYGTLPDAQLDKIAKHVMEGDDWLTMTDLTNEEENNLMALVDGTKNDHPEWFDSLEDKARDWMYRHGQAVLDDMEDDVMEEQEVTREEAQQIIRLIEDAEMIIKF